MPRDRLVISDGDLDERHQAVPAVAAVDGVQESLEGLVGGEEVAGVEEPHARPEARGKAVGRHARYSIPASGRVRAPRRGGPTGWRDRPGRTSGRLLAPVALDLDRDP